MAGHAIRRAQGVVVVYVALSAGRACMRAGQREAGDAVIKRHGCPRCRIVAIRAVRGSKRRPRGGVWRVVRLLPGRQVAPGVSAIRGRNLQAVIVVDVAACAGHVGVASRQWETRRGVVEVSVQPGVEIVAALAVA